MKKAKRVLSLVLAMVMAFTIGIPTAFAKTGVNVYEAATINPDAYVDGVQKLRFNTEQGAGYVLDLLDNLLNDLNFYMEGYQVAEFLGIKVKLNIYLRDVDEALWSLYNIVKGVADSNSDCLDNVVDGINSTILSWVVGALNLGYLEDLNVSVLGDQNSSSRLTRNVPSGNSKTATNDMAVLSLLVKFLMTNRETLSNIINSDESLSDRVGSILGGIDMVKQYLTNLPEFLKKLLYSKLWDSDFDTDEDSIPSGWTYDTGLQDIIDWALIEGTGTTSEDGGKSILGENFEAFLPAMGDQPGAASVTGQNFYHLVNNAINALLSGMVSDLLKDLLVDMLDIDVTANDGKGNTDVMSDMIYTTVVNAIKTLCEKNGAPELVFSEDGSTYPICQIDELLDWFFNGGGLSTFIKIEYEGISITDNFISLLNMVARLLPGLLPVFGLDIDTSIVDLDSITETVEDDEVHGKLYSTFEGETVYLEDGSYFYLDTETQVNTEDEDASDYRNPSFITDKYVLGMDKVWGVFAKLIFSMFIDGFYCPEWADDIASVAAYAVASIAAVYLPQNDYFDRLDQYHYVDVEGGTFSPRAAGSVESLPYTEEVTVGSKTVTIPRAVMDIGASLASYFISGWQQFDGVWTYGLETDNTWENFAFEFIIWAANTYLPVFTGSYNGSTHTYGNIKDSAGNTTSVTGTWQTYFNSYMSQYQTLLAANPTTGSVGNYKSNIDPADLRDITYGLLDTIIFGLIPSNWLPTEYASNGMKGVVEDWLLDSVVNFDLQKLIGMFSINPSGELAQNSTLKVILNLIDRVLATVFGGYAILPSCAEGTSGRNIYSGSGKGVATTLTTLEGLLSNSTIKTLLTNLLYRLNQYLWPLASTIFPLLMSNTVKAASYYETSADTTKSSPLGGAQISYDELLDYYNEKNTDLNTTVFSGKLYYKEAKAQTIADEIGGTYGSELVNGSTKYYVQFPESYKQLSKADKAADYLQAADGYDTAYVSTVRENGKITYKVLYKDSYRTTATNYPPVETPIYVDGVITEKSYTFGDIARAMPNTTSGSDAAKYRTGSKGEVSYEDGYRTFGREDYYGYEMKWAFRYENAIEDAKEFMDSFDSYAESTLPDAYGEWLMYFVKVQLAAMGKYDTDDDGEMESAPSPSKSTPYPFYASSGTVNDEYLNYTSTGTAGEDKTAVRNNWVNQGYALNKNGYKVTQAAIAYSQELDEETGERIHDRTLGLNDTKWVVRYALQNATVFDVEADNPWSAFTATQISTISSACTGLGMTLKADEENEGHYIITRPAFQLITTINSKSAFGTVEGSSLSMTPATSRNNVSTMEISAYQKAQDSLHEAYVLYASKCKEFDDGLNDYYDNISWRNARAENNNSKVPDTTSLAWVLSYTQEAYMNTNGNRNKRMSAGGNWVTAYTAKSYDEFQLAYEFATQLKNQIDSDRNYAKVDQALVTEAYQAVLAAYYALVPAGEPADWTELLAYIAQALSIWEGDLGYNNGDYNELGYTVESLTNLKSALDYANEFYANGASYDISNQEDIDDEATELYYVIQALEFNEGVKPGAILTSGDGNTVYSLPTGEDGQTLIYTKTGITAEYSIITGLTEGVNFTEYTQQATPNSIPQYYDETSGEYVDCFSAVGFIAKTEKLQDTDTINFFAEQGTYGGGTSSFLEGRYGSGTFRYYAVLFGDLNGDTRIDGTDATILDMWLAQYGEGINDVELYLIAAADVTGDGEVDSDDIDMIQGHYQKEDGVTISQAERSTAYWETLGLNAQ